MSKLMASPPVEFDTSSVRDEVLSFGVGLVFTAVLFVAIANVDTTNPAKTEPEIEDLRAILIPLDPPPPRVVEQSMPVEESTPFAGLEIEGTDSAVKIAVVPPDLSALLPAEDGPPAAVIHSAGLHTHFKPSMELAIDFSRVFQHTEVDQRPMVLSRPNPRIPPAVRNDAERLRVSLLVLIDPRGGVSNVRVLKPSGNPQFDTIIATSVSTEWRFSPAIKQGRKVRCLLQQAVLVTWSREGSRFSL